MKKIYKLIISIAIPLIVGYSSSYFTISSIKSWYINIEKPSFNPPNWIFGPVWTILYILIGLSFYFIWKKGFGKNKNKIITIYSIQLALNFLWSFSFFYLQSPILGLINIVLLLITIIFNIKIFYKRKKLSGYLLIPYLLWVSFASILNLSIFLLN